MFPPCRTEAVSIRVPEIRKTLRIMEDTLRELRDELRRDKEDAALAKTDYEKVTRLQHDWCQARSDVHYSSLFRDRVPAPHCLLCLLIWLHSVRYAGFRYSSSASCDGF